MSSVHDYESWAIVGDRMTRVLPVLTESYSGVSMVKWYGNIERSLGGLLDDAEKGRNWPYADKIRAFLKVWRDNEIDGSINRETLDVLMNAAGMLAVDSWNLKNYFSNLRDNLRMAIASEEQLPRDMDMNANDPMGGAGGGGGRGAPPMNPEFGPEDKAPDADGQPPDLEADPDQAGGEDAKGGGLEGGPPAPGDEDLPDNARNQ